MGTKHSLATVLPKAKNDLSMVTRGPFGALFLFGLLSWMTLMSRDDSNPHGEGQIVFGAFIRDSRGATSIEYALIASLISITIIGALLLFQGEMSNMFQYISDHLDPVLGSDG